MKFLLSNEFHRHNLEDPLKNIEHMNVMSLACFLPVKKQIRTGEDESDTNRGNNNEEWNEI